MRKNGFFELNGTFLSQKVGKIRDLQLPICQQEKITNH